MDLYTKLFYIAEYLWWYFSFDTILLFQVYINERSIDMDGWSKHIYVSLKCFYIDSYSRPI